MSGVKGIATALAKAQLQMGKALRTSTNPHFKSKYADLASVMEACMDALNSNGIAVIQPIETETENGLSVTTVLIHGESGESLHNHVPIVVAKNDMQGYGSAYTYARRYGLMMMAGLATEDDDGNAAAKAKPQSITDDQMAQIDDLVKETNTNQKKMLAVYGVSKLQELNIDQAKKCLGLLKTKMQKQIADQAHAEETVEKIETVYEAAQENAVIELKKQKGSADGTAD